MRCEISPLAAQDLQDIGDYIAADNPRRAESFIDELLAHGAQIANMPVAYPLREDLAPQLRSCSHKRYVIFFTVGKSAVRIERILHSAQDVVAISFN